MVSRAKMEAVLCREQVQRGSRVVLQSHSRTVKRGLTGTLGPDKEGRSLDFCPKKYYSPSLEVVGGGGVS